MTDVRYPVDSELSETPGPEPGGDETPHPVPSEADQAAFFLRLSAELDEMDLEPAPMWQARTLGYLALDPLLRRRTMAALATLTLTCLAFGGYTLYQATRPAAPLRLPPGYMLLHTAGGQVVATATHEEPQREALRQDAWAELQELLKKPASSAPGDAIAVSSTTSPGHY